MIVGQRIVQLASKLIPDAVFAVFSCRDDQVIGRVPVACKDYTIVGLPGNLLVPRQCWLDDQVLVAAVENSVAIGRPNEAVDGLATLNYLRTKHATTRPSLDLSVLSRCSQSALVAPLEADNGGQVSFTDILFDSASLADELE